jgi:50S ribosomal protein L16 3-hydroxylase
MILNDLVSQVGLEIFFDEYLYKKPFAAQKTAKAFENLISWPMLEQIFSAQHRECWLPKNGLLPEDPWLNRGLLTACQAKKEFALGRTVLVRHSEKVAPCLASIASDFYKLFDRTVDIQIYVTPAGEEGFDWHYDNEDVFVVQSQGEKEFRLLPNTVCRKPLPMFNPHKFAAG